MTPQRSHAGAMLAGIVLWGIGLSIGVAGVSLLTAELTDPELDAKITHLEKNLAKYDTLFFGSSRIYRGFDPLVFDRDMAAHGERTSSFNLAFRTGSRVHRCAPLRQPPPSMSTEIAPVLRCEAATRRNQNRAPNPGRLHFLSRVCA